MELKYFDAHCHVQFDHYERDRDELLARMQAERVGGIVVGCNLESSKKAAALAGEHEHLYAAVGLHPNHEADEWFEAAPYRELAKSPKVVAIGECGLDYYRNDASDEIKRKQKAIFNDQIALAVELDKPLIIHARPSKGTMDAYQDLIGILKNAKAAHGGAVHGDVHFFVGGVPEMHELIALGFTVSFTAVITFARDYDEVIRAAPLDAILSETDAPYVPPTNRPRGSRNDPLAVQDVVAKIAEVRGEDLEIIRVALLENAKRLFAL
ncbi:TatD family hydrolase [Candidatus Kaiserbacteria bacterium]|nr:TatD family hydrolase [Candidatus Kaiserbacteria bacterium]